MAASWPIQFTKGSRSAVKRCQQSTEEDTIQFCIKKQNLTGYTILPKNGGTDTKTIGQTKPQFLSDPME
jgi:hypothetical protein